LAFAAVRAGRLVDAEELMQREVGAVTARHGRGSVPWASVQCDLGNVLLNADQLDRAIGCFRNAVAGTANQPDSEVRKDHLTYRMNLGLALRMAGRLDEAESELRQGAAERLSFYGRAHAGYAFGLEPLADVLLQRADVPQARQVIEETVDNFRRNGHERIATALALRAEIVAAAGGPDPLFPPLDDLPDKLVEEMARSVVNRSRLSDPATYQAVLTGLIEVLEARLGPDHQATLTTLSTLANVGHGRGDQAVRVGAIRRVLASYDRRGRAEDALMAALGLAMACSDAGDQDEALRTYESAYARAERIGRPELTSQVLRNWGLALRESGHVPAAELRLNEAVAHARRGGDPGMLGRADIALGIFLQHQERFDAARPVLEEGLSVLDPTHPDAIAGRSHLGAVLDGRTCGCGDIAMTMTDAFRQFVVSRLPADLLERFDVTLEGGDFKIEVHLRRKPTDEELHRLNGVVQSAHAEFRRRLSSTR
jgi:tetratricopeptide (TPR) repeat protein